MYDKSYGPKRFSNTTHYKCDNRETTMTGTKNYSPHHKRTLFYSSFPYIAHTKNCFLEKKQIFENGPKFSIVK